VRLPMDVLVQHDIDGLTLGLTLICKHGQAPWHENEHGTGELGAEPMPERTPAVAFARHPAM